MSMLRAMQRTSLNVHLTVAQRSVCVVALSLLTACATRLDNAPVVDRSGDLGIGKNVWGVHRKVARSRVKIP